MQGEKFCSHQNGFCSKVFAGIVGKQGKKVSQLIQLNQQNVKVWLGAFLCQCSGLVTVMECVCVYIYINKNKIRLCLETLFVEALSYFEFFSEEFLQLQGKQ